MIQRCAARWKHLIGSLGETLSDEVVLEELKALEISGMPFQEVFADVPLLPFSACVEAGPSQTRECQLSPAAHQLPDPIDFSAPNVTLWPIG